MKVKVRENANLAEVMLKVAVSTILIMFMAPKVLPPKHEDAANAKDAIEKIVVNALLVWISRNLAAKDSKSCEQADAAARRWRRTLGAAN